MSIVSNVGGPRYVLLHPSTFTDFLRTGLLREGKGEAGGLVGDQLPVSGLLVNVSPDIRGASVDPPGVYNSP